MKIPIQNIYFLLCYAWNQLEEKEKINVEASDYNSYINLFAKILLNGSVYLFKRGLDRDYISYEEVIAGIRGKIDFGVSLKLNLFHQARAFCSFDELDYNILHNQIIKTTIGKVLKVQDLDKEIRNRLAEVYKRFKNVDEVKINGNIYKNVRLHRNNQFYRFLLNVSRIINENLVLDEKTGDYQFMDFVRDEHKMAYVFENFVRNFYAKEQSVFRVKPELINWIATTENEKDLAYLPLMKTDISLDSPQRKIIIDTKYYLEALKPHHDQNKVISANLYQLFSYVKNVEAQGEVARNCEGILLYPTVQDEIDLNYKMENHTIRIKTICLNQDWRSIYSGLLEIIQ